MGIKKRCGVNRIQVEDIVFGLKQANDPCPTTKEPK